jgi:4-amino-4-deoxy-L-arabinose transferase-like glycosyltransferase
MARDGRSRWLAVAALTAVGLALRLKGLGHRALWWDEIALVLRALGAPDPSQDGPWNVLVTRLAILLSGSEDPIWLRLPSALQSAAAIPVLYAAGVAAGGRRVGLAAAAFLAASPLAVHWSSYVRPYGALSLASALLVLTGIRACADDAPGRWLALAAAVAFAGTVHLVAGLLVAGLVVAYLLGGRLTPGRTLRFAAALAAGALGASWVLARDRAGSVLEGVALVGPVRFLGRATVGLAAGEVPASLDYALVPPVVVATAVMLLLIAIGARRLRHDAALVAAAMIVTTYVGLFLTLGGKSSWPWMRYGSQLAAPAALLAGAGLAGLRRPRAVLAALALVPGIVVGLQGSAALLAGEADMEEARTAQLRRAETAPALILFAADTRYGDETERALKMYLDRRRRDVPVYVLAGGVARALEAAGRGGSVVPRLGAPVPLPAGEYAILDSGQGRSCLDLERALGGRDVTRTDRRSPPTCRVGAGP